MGIYFNPGNAGFEAIINDEYIDKTGMIALINRESLNHFSHDWRGIDEEL